MKSNTIRFLPAIAWSILVTVLLTLPGSSLPSEDWLGKIWIDKWVHLGLFSIAIILWYNSKIRTGNLKRSLLWIAIGGLLYGIAMEFVQKYFIPGRSFDLGDILADGLGCLLGAVFCWWRYIKK